MLTTKKFHIILFYGNLQTGGIQSLIVRLSNWLVHNNVEVTLFLDSGGELTSLLDGRIEIIISGKSCIHFNKFFFSKHYPNLLAKKVDAVFSFDIPSLIVAILFYSNYKRPLRFINGVFHPDALKTKILALSKGDDAIKYFLLHIYNDLLDDRSKFFMNDEVRKKTQKFIRRDITRAEILPIPINMFPLRRFDRSIQRRRKIVSVGRLTEFKTYNLYFLDVVAELKRDGFECDWHVYGHGELEQKMVDRILELGISENVKLYGKLPYDKFVSILDNALLFVGMGTSIIEAGSRGVPVIPAIIDCGPYSYGYLYEMPGYQLGEILDVLPTKPMSVLVKRLITLDERSYLDECLKTRDYCLQYDITKLGEKYFDFFRSCGTSMNLLSITDSREFSELLASYRRRLIKVYIMRLFISLSKRLLPSWIRDYIRGKVLAAR